MSYKLAIFFYCLIFSIVLLLVFVTCWPLSIWYRLWYGEWQNPARLINDTPWRYNGTKSM
jgi:hypothetical protein